jgi:hypothetical protein
MILGSVQRWLFLVNLQFTSNSVEVSERVYYADETPKIRFEIKTSQANTKQGFGKAEG